MLKKGDFFTITEWLSHKDRSYVGDVFELSVQDGEFISAVCHTGYFKGDKVQLNLNDVRTRLLSLRYVYDVCPELKPENPFRAVL
jgi:hypothetical protein